MDPSAVSLLFEREELTLCGGLFALGDALGTGFISLGRSVVTMLIAK
jgi:hypothetical protein